MAVFNLADFLLPLQADCIAQQPDQVHEMVFQALRALDGAGGDVAAAKVVLERCLGQPEAFDIAEQLEKRSGFRRTMKRAMEQTMEAGAKGIKIQLSGRLGGAEMSRREKQISGSIPLSTLRAKIDYGFTEALIAQGHIGVQVWINQGMYNEDDNDGADAKTGQAPKKPKRTYKR